MAIAVKRELAHTRFARLSRMLADEGRTGLKLTCPQGGCRQEYVVYFGSVTEEEEMRWLFDGRVGQHHPCHLDLYTFDEPMPRWTQGEETLIRTEASPKAQTENPAFDMIRSLRQKMLLRRALPSQLTPAGKRAGLLGRTSKVFAGCLAFAVAAVPMAVRAPFLFGSK
jgi:hypothetical protein